LALRLVALALLATACGSAGAEGAAVPRAIVPDPSPSLAPSATAAAVSPSVTPAVVGVAFAPLCTDLQMLSSWSLSRRAAQLVVVPVDETDVAAVAASVQAGAGGVILFGNAAPQNLGTQVQALVAQAPAGLVPLVMTDEEGGGVQRMANLVGSMPWPATAAATMSPEEVREMAERVGRLMVQNGVTMDLAPVLDLASGPGPDALHTDGPRSFGLSPQTATTYGLAFAEGLEAAGVTPVVKHFPGEGQASANTDDGPASTPPLAALEKADLLPFEAAVSAGLPAVMVGNATVPGLSVMPASLSAAVVTGLLRQQLGFQGLVLTDSLSAAAISSLGISVPQAAEEAVAAGADMVLFTSTNADTTFQSVVGELVTAVSTGKLPVTTLNAAVAEVLTAKGVGLCRPPRP
jgi:beta-N-acetylhexosaminidase